MRRVKYGVYRKKNEKKKTWRKETRKDGTCDGRGEEGKGRKKSEK